VHGLSALPLGNDQSYPHGAVAPTIVATTPTLTSTTETAGLDLIAPPFTLLPDQGRAAPPKKTILTPSFCKSNIQPRERLVAAHGHYIDAYKSAWPAGCAQRHARARGGGRRRPLSSSATS